MSTVVHFVEFIMMSLAGIMLYKLYISYKAWKHSTAFTAHSETFAVSKKTLDFSSGSSRSDSLAVNKLRLIDSKTTLENSLLEVPVMQISLKDNKSSDILNDYIGEFFSEPQLMNIEPFRVAESKTSVALDKSVGQEVLSSASSDLSIEEDIIKVEPNIVGSNEKYDIKTREAVHVEDDAVPTLNEFSDLESESFITVASVNHDNEDTNKVMSDKVVMAMLDEAKLVCAS